MFTADSLKLKAVARKRQEYGLCYSFSMMPALYLSGYRKDDSRGEKTCLEGRFTEHDERDR
ncbi:MAG: hypothetical protein OEU97_02750 [Dehalococcoidia bacterium]|nr:hypothetical protein [Dehalococcoidia bacterium]